MRMNWCAIAAVLICVEDARTTIAQEVRSESRADIVATVIRRTDGIEGKGRFTYVNLKIQNRIDKAIWVVFPAQAEEGFPANGVFKEEPSPVEPFPAYKIPGGKEAAIRISLPGGSEAFRLPARARFEADGYLLMSHKDIDRVAMMDAEELMVNGKTPLQKWLPFEVTSGGNVRVDYEKDVELCLNVEPGTNKRRKDFPSESVEKVVPTEFKVRTLQLSQAGK